MPINSTTSTPSPVGRCAIWLAVLALLGGPLTVAAQPPQPQPPEPAATVESTAPAAPQDPVPAAEDAPAADAGENAEERFEEALGELEEKLDELQDEIDEELSNAEAERGDVARDLRERRRQMLDTREQIRRSLRRSGRTSTDAKVSFGSDLHIATDQIASDAVTVGGSVTVDGTVRGDAVAIGGSVEVEGQVTGDVVAVGGRVILGPEAEVLGTVTSVGSKVERAEGASVLGGVNEISFGDSFDMDWFDWGDAFEYDGFRPLRFLNLAELIWGLVAVAMLLVLCALTLLIGGNTVDRVRRKAAASFWVAAGVGLASQLLIVPLLVIVCLILLISIIGIPLILLLPFVVLAFMVAALVGLTAAAIGVGRWSERRFGWNLGSPYMALLVGLLIINSLSIVSDVLGTMGGFLTVFTVMFGLVGFLVEYLAWTVGLGAVILSLLQRSTSPPPAAASAPSPPPSSPPPPPAPDVASRDRGGLTSAEESGSGVADRPYEPPGGPSTDS